MRYAILDPLFSPITTLTGISPKVATLVEKVVPADLCDRSARASDLLFVLPNSVIDRRNRHGIAYAADGAIVTLEVRIDRHQPAPRGNRSVPYRVFAYDDTGEITLTFFHVHAAYLKKAMPEGKKVIVSGRMERFKSRQSIVHPDHIVLASEASKLPLVEPVYPLTAGLSAKVLRRAIGQAIEHVPAMPEWIGADVMRRHNFPNFAAALLRVHNPTDPIDASPENAAWRRLAYDELLAGQVSLALVRACARKLHGRQLLGNGLVVDALRKAHSYALTASQERALVEINADLAKPERMLRLIQGDVGSGKTVVALLAMARAVEAGGQAALMAPTEILVRQHFAGISPLAERVGLTVATLTGREKGQERTQILANLKSGKIDIVIGTHALFQKAVVFHDLALAVIDEQHRFGVHQRLAMTAKGRASDILVMTATPIPRTLALTAFSDMDVSCLTEKPAGRHPIRTVTMSLDRIDELIGRMHDAVADGQKIYWICPLIEESEEIKLMAAEDRFASLQPVFGQRIGLVHGRMKGAEKDEAMYGFKEGKTRVLIATTVIEVGVDVTDATIIVIEHAERFGLAQLHQLRGRVGRGSKPSSCVLLYKDPLSETAKRRLSVMRDTEDGFLIAEEDLKLRGEGELLGTRQSGTPSFQVARIGAHADLLAIARDDARLILARDPNLQTPRGEALKLLLYLFSRDEALRLLRAG